MMKAYEPGERWHHDGEGDGTVFDHDGHVVAQCRTEEHARLITESPERDELLREIKRRIDDESLVGLDVPIKALAARIDATLRRSEG